MVPPLASYGPQDPGFERYPWLTPERLVRVRAILLALTLFFGMVVWIFHGLGPVAGGDHAQLVRRLRGLGVMTWLYALVQMVDLRFWNSRFARRRRLQLGIPESLHGWLFGQMLAWFGILYYGITEDARWYAAGLILLLVSFLAFPIRRVH